MPQRYLLKQIRPEDIDVSFFNPRGENAEEIQGDPEFEQLKDSVFKYGVLVPVVVHASGKGKPYRLVDGERRVRAALATKRETIPAHVTSAEKRLDDLIQAFHIHMLRKQWKQVARTRALKRISDELRRRRPSASVSELLEELRTATGCSPTTLRTLRRASKFPESVLSAVDQGRLNFSHLVQIEESFMEPVASRFPDLLKELGGEQQVRQALVNKAQKRSLTTTRALMENVAPVIARAEEAEDEAQKNYVKQLLTKFIGAPSMTAESVLEQYEARYPTSGANLIELGSEVRDMAARLAQLLAHVQGPMIKGYPQLIREIRKNLVELQKTIKVVLRRTDKVAQ